MIFRQFACYLLVFACSLATAQEPAVTELAVGDEKPPRPEPQVFELTVTPAGEPSPALQHRLLPPFLERNDENAAPIYLRALFMLEGHEGANVKPGDELWNDISNWLEADAGKLPKDEVRKALDRFRPAMSETRIAARREKCDWAMGVRERREIYETLLPEVQSTRNLARLIALETRLHIANRDFDAAIESLQVGYTLARHVAEQPFLISGLVGAAIANMMNEQLQTLIAASDSPNLYWPIAALPQPLVDLRPSFEVEGSSLFIMFPKLRDVRQREMTPEEWRKEFRESIRQAAGLLSLVEDEEKGLAGVAKEIARAAALEAMLELRYPTARKELLGWGFDEKRLEAMPKGQLVLVHEVEYFERTRDELFKWFGLPYWQAYDGLQAADAVFVDRVKKRDKLTPPPLADVVLPAMTNVYTAQARGERRFAALQAIEALRMYAAAHEGRWPKTLADEGLRPIPRNSFTGAAPEYAEADGVATLTYAGRGREADLVYKLRVKK